MHIEIITAEDIQVIHKELIELKEMFRQLIDQQPKPLPDFLTPKEAREVLGYKSASGLNSRLREAGVSKVETPRGWRYRKEDILKLISE